MKERKNIKIIGIDHGYGNIKTANCCFPSGVKMSETEPVFRQDLLIYKDKYYSVGVGHKEYIPDKIADNDYYILTLAAIARELNRENIREADVFIAAGLPLSWLGIQRNSFRNYLLQNKTAEFCFRGKDYRINIIGAEVFPQGFASVAERIKDFTGANLLCDIGNGTMNILRINDRKIDTQNMFTEMAGVNQCVLAMRENLLRINSARIDEETIHRFLKNGTAGIDAEIEKTMRETATEYTENIFRILRERGYDKRIMKLHISGGGGVLIKNFCKEAPDRITIDDDICSAAKGFEFMAEMKLRKDKKT